MLTLIQRLPTSTHIPVSFTLSLCAEERTRSRYRFETAQGEVMLLRLPRGTVLRDGDLLQSESGEVVRIAAKPEPAFTVRAKTSINLLQAAYHLGNRHVPLEIAPTYLRLSPESVLKTMLEGLGVEITEEVVPFQPEIGAYRHHPNWE